MRTEWRIRSVERWVESIGDLAQVTLSEGEERKKEWSFVILLQGKKLWSKVRACLRYMTPPYMFLFYFYLFVY